MKRLLLLLAAALPAAAEDARVQAGNHIARLWELRRKQENLSTQESAAGASAAIHKLYPNLLNPSGLVFRFPESASKEVRAKALEVLKKRLAALGAKEPKLVSHDGTEVFLLLNAADEKAIGDDRATLGSAGPLQFRLEASEEAREEWKKTGVLPKGTAVFTGDDGKFLAVAEVSLDSSAVSEATVFADPAGPQIRLKFTEAGSAAMEKVTADNINRRLAICSGHRVLSAPTIMARVVGEVAISGRFGRAACDRIVATFNAGILPCEMEETSSSTGSTGEEAWKPEPAGTFIERMLGNNLVHAILEDVLRDQQPTAYAEILKATEKR